MDEFSVGSPTGVVPRDTDRNDIDRQPKVQSLRSTDMADHENSEAGHLERRTAPQGSYTMRDVGVGFVVALVGMAVVFGVPFLTQL